LSLSGRFGERGSVFTGSPAGHLTPPGGSLAYSVRTLAEAAFTTGTHMQSKMISTPRLAKQLHAPDWQLYRVLDALECAGVEFGRFGNARVIRDDQGPAVQKEMARRGWLKQEALASA